MKNTLQIKTYKPSHKTITILKLRATLLTAAVAFLVGVITVFSPVIAIVTGFVYIIAYTLTISVYAPLMYKASNIIIDSKKITAEKGVIFHRKYCMAFNTIEYTVKTYTPLQKKLGLCSLLIYSKGGRIVISNISTHQILPAI